MLVFEVPFPGKFCAPCWDHLCVPLRVLALGIFLSAVARSQILAFQMGIISSFLPAFLLSGFIFSIENMPWVVQVVTHIVPARYFVTLLKGIFLKGGVSVLWQEIAFLVLYSLIVFEGTRKSGQLAGLMNLGLPQAG
ncbi:MAG: ABC transporter permease [Terriglobia bacterium]